MTDTQNGTLAPIWFEGLQTETGEPLVLDEVVGDIVYVRQADPGDDTSARVRLDPGQRLHVASPVGCIAVCLSDEVGADDAIYWVRLVLDSRDDGVAYGRSLRR